jgi:hypothetical protein
MVMRQVGWVSQGTGGTDICWAASAEMWAKAEGIAYWTRDQYVDFASQGLAYNPGANAGQGLDSLSSFLRNSVNALYPLGGSIPITTIVATSMTDVPDLANIIDNVGTIYAAFTYPGQTTGHCVVIYGTDDAGITFCADPLPNMVWTQCNVSYWYTALPAFFAYRTPGINT